MSSSDGACEIMAEDEVNFAHHFKGLKPINCKVRVDARFEKIYGHGDGCGRGQLAEAFDLGTTPRPKSPFCQAGVDLQPRNTLKKPIRVGSFPQPSGIGISESVTLKQALRKLCISQASEMAAMKRLSKPIGVSGISEAGNIKRLYASVVVQSNESVDKEKGSLFEISIVPQKIGPEFRGQTSGSAETCTEETPSKTNIPSHTSPRAAKKVMKLRVKDVIASPLTDFGTKSSVGVAKGKSKTQARDCIPQLGDQTTKLCSSPCPTRPAPKNKNFFKGNDSTPASGYSGICSKGDTLRSNNTKQGCQKEASLAAAGHRKQNNPVTPKRNVCNATKYDSTVDSGNGDGILRGEVSEGARSKEKGESSQSSKSSMGDHSSSTSVSDESSQSTSSGRGRGCRPHMSKDFRWIAIRQTEMHQGSIGLDNFMLLKRLGCGDIGTVYLAELIGTECLFALKVMDNDFLLSRKKMSRAQTEREILQILDHPFLPTLYTYFTTDNLSCLVMEYCPGGDLHVLRQRQPGRSFSEPAARFYVAEVLLALEYLHMLGVVYRDLKPENILVREDGHIMLSDFDLSLRCAVSPTLLRSSSSLGLGDSGRRASGTCAESSSCVDPRCLHPSWVQVSCFGPSAAAAASSAGGKKKGELAGGPAALPQLVAEPTEARSNSFVGTHEYLAPEIIKGDGHGSSVDWWTLGIFLYELLFGRTPFKGAGNEETLANVVTQSLTFPAGPAVGLQARDLIRGLLVKEPEDRLGSLRGAAEIKQHPFFQGLNWALIRCAAPPETRPPPAPVAPAPAAVSSRGKKEGGGCLEFRTHGERVEFELF